MRVRLDFDIGVSPQQRKQARESRQAVIGADIAYHVVQRGVRRKKSRKKGTVRGILEREPRSGGSKASGGTAGSAAGKGSPAPTASCTTGGEQQAECEQQAD